MTPTCPTCRRPVTDPVPEKWWQKYPDLRGLCRDCAFAWITANLPEDRPQHQQQPPADGGPGWLDGVMDGEATS